MKRILACVGIVGLLFGSLVCFPSCVSWMVLVWLCVALVAFNADKPVWPWLVGVAVVLGIKRTGFTVELIFLIGALIYVAALDWRFRCRSEIRFSAKRFAFYFVPLLAALLFFATTRWFNANPTHLRPLDDRPIACLGDSLTDFGYPQELEKLISVPIADFGVDGITTDDGIEMVPEILAADPQLVVIELGGHDYNGENKTRAELRRNLGILIESFRQRDIGVILVEVPRGIISDPYDGLERELATEYDLKLVSDSMIRKLIFNSSKLPPGIWMDPSRRYSDDGLHPNENGNRFCARTVADALVSVFGDSVLKQ